MSFYIAATKGVQLGSYIACMPAVLVIGGDGKIISKYVASSPGDVTKLFQTALNKIIFFLRKYLESVQLTVDEILQIVMG